MSEVEVRYRELSEIPHLDAVPLAHLSVQVGHWSLDDFFESERVIARRFEQAAPWLEAAGKTIRKRFGRAARISTCLLVDDHSAALPANEEPEPSAVLERVVHIAATVGMRIDYLGRDAGCAVASDRPNPGPRDQHRLADIVAAQIVEEAAVGADGSRPPSTLSGWLANGQRSPAFQEAMGPPVWTPPVAFGLERHSVFVDVELWSLGSDATELFGERHYSISMLTAVWQLLRLGLLRDAGVAVAVPYLFGPDEPVPGRWSELPSIIRLTPDPAPFAAYQALSLLPAAHRGVEHAAGIVLDHVRLDDRVLDLIADRARAEGVPVPAVPAPAGRISHVFLDELYDAFDE